jgi:predicted enzyme related to lactoylglutathione lyase
MPGQPAHFEIPADDTAKARQFWGSLFDWQFEASPGPFEYYMTRISDQAGVAITNMESPASVAFAPTSTWTTSTPAPPA